MGSYRNMLIAVMCCVSSFGAYAQEFNYRSLNMDDGLSHHSVITMYQDERDLIWVGTSHGLNLYSGYDFTTYKTDPHDPSSIFCDNILRITGDHAGKVWIQTLDGVAEFDIPRERFTTICAGENMQIHYSDALYIARDQRIDRYHNGTIHPYYILRNASSAITALYVDTLSGTTIAGTASSGVFAIRRVDGDVVETNPIATGSVTNIFKDSRGQYWIGTIDDGFYLADEDFTNIRHFRHAPRDPYSISSDFVRVFCEDRDGQIYIGTFNGFNTFDPASGRFARYSNLGGSNGLESTSIWSMICDRANNIWIGTFFEGIYSFNPTRSIFRKYEASSVESRGLSSPIVSGMAQDENDNLYIATEVGGFNRYDRSTGRFKWFRRLADSPEKEPYNNIKGLYYDPMRKALWLGTHMGGLFRFDTRTERLTQYVLPSGIVRQILARGNELILATHAGLFLFDPESGKHRELPGDGVSPGTIVGHICLSHDNRQLWFAGDQSMLYCYDFESRRIVSIRVGETSPTVKSRITYIYEDASGRVWVCTENDAMYVRERPGEAFSRLDLFTGNRICSVAEIEQDRFVVAASNGISIYDHARGTVYKQFTQTEIPLQMINQGALFVSSDGTVYVGGTDGMISFDASKFTRRDLYTQIFPMRMTVDGQNLPMKTIFDENAAEANEKTLRLSHKQSIMQLKYAIINAAFSSFVVEYRLFWRQSDLWTPMPADNTVTLTNLKPARYQLQVRAKDNYGNVLTTHTTPFRIFPPWYSRWWAYILFAACVGAILYAVIRAYLTHIKLYESLKYERKYNKNLEQLSQSKLRFFTNVAHEFRTPLTVILGHMESLLQMRITQPVIYRKLLSIYKNGIMLRNLITELLDFRSQEQGYMKIHAGEYDLNAFLYENYSLYREYALTRNIDLEFVAPQGEIRVWFDTMQMQKVVNNLLSNAFKYTEKDRGRIVLRVEDEADEVTFSVEDNGKGIPEGELESIFHRFYRADTVNIGTGIGLALAKGIVELHGGTIRVTSRPNEGSVFSVTLSKGRGHLRDDQIEEDHGTLPASTIIPDSIAAGAISDGQEDPVPGIADVEGKKFKMLVVEDNESLRNLFTEIFAPYYAVETAENGVAALEKMKTITPDIIVSDVAMPEMSGIDLCRAVKNDFDTSHIPVVLLTAYGSTDNQIRGLQAGADDYVIKPFSTTTLISRCNNLINNRLLLKEKFRGQGQVSPENLAYTPVDREFIDRAMEVIDHNISNPEFSTTQFAQEMLVARTKLFVKLKAITGQTPYEFILTIKLNRAADMLLNEHQYNMSDISDLLGFNTLRYFSKCFKDRYGVSPLQYRKNADKQKN